MSDTPQGQGWWQASDGNWYPPEQHPSYQQPTTPAAPPAPPPIPPSGTRSASRSGRQSVRTPVPAEIAVLAGGVLVLIFSFLPFYKVSVSYASRSTNAWGSGLFPTATLITLFGVIAAALVAAMLFDVSLPKRMVTFTKEQIVVACGLFATILAVAFLIQDHSPYDVGIGYWFMLIGAIAVLVGGILMLREAPDATS